MERMKAINLPHFKMKLMDISRSLFREHGWQMPRGLVNSKERDPANYTLAEWQQAKRTGHDPKALKGMFQELWQASDSGKAFSAGLASRGFTLARGDRRSHVAVDYRGEVYAIARYTGVKTKDVRGRLSNADELPSIEQAKSAIAARMTEMLQRHIRDTEAKHKRQSASLAFKKEQIVQRQRAEREQLRQRQEERQAQETKERAARFSRGFRGLWDRFTGKHSKIRAQNEHEALQAATRDRTERDRLIHRQLEERRTLHRQIKWERKPTPSKSKNSTGTLPASSASAHRRMRVSNSRRP